MRQLLLHPRLPRDSVRPRCIRLPCSSSLGKPHPCSRACYRRNACTQVNCCRRSLRAQRLRLRWCTRRYCCIRLGCSCRRCGSANTQTKRHNRRWCGIRRRDCSSRRGSLARSRSAARRRRWQRRAHTGRRRSSHFCRDDQRRMSCCRSRSCTPGLRGIHWTSRRCRRGWCTWWDRT